MIVNTIPAQGKIPTRNLFVFQDRRYTLQVIFVKDFRFFVPPERDIELTIPVYPEKPVITGAIEKNNFGSPPWPGTVIILKIESWQLIIE